MSRGTVLVADDDLFLRPRIEADLRRGGFTPVFAGSPARFLEALGACPDAILVNLAARTLAFAELVAAAREACPRAAITWYGPHVDEALFAAGRAAGCTAVVPNGAVARGSAQVVAAALDAADDRDDPLPAGIRRGIELFNEGAYYEAHEVMEEAWRATPGAERVFYQGLIQVAVALWRVTRGDASIALTMCARGLPKLAPFRPSFAGIDVEALYRGMERVRDQVLALGKEHLSEFDRAQFPRILPSPRNPA